MWFEERLITSKEHSFNNMLLISGQAGVGKSATVHAIASHLGAEVCEWNTPTPVIWKEHLHNSNSGVRYMSKLDEFEQFVERIRKYGLISSSWTRASSPSIILLVDDLPAVNGKVSYGRIHRCLHLLLQSVCLPTAILINESGKSDSAEQPTRYWDELQISLVNAGASKVAFNPITVNSIKRALSKICRLEQLEVDHEQIDLIAKSSGGDIRNAITSLQYFSLKPYLTHSVSFPKSISTYTEEVDEISQMDGGVFYSFGRDATLSLFHALGKFLHNKRETGNLVDPDRDTIPLKEKFIRPPLKMEAPETVLCQAQGQARPIAEFLHENVLDFVSEEAVDDAWVISSYLSDADMLLVSLNRTLSRQVEAENLIQSATASIAVRGVLYGNAHPVSSGWRAIRRPNLWQVEQSLRQNKCQLVQERSSSLGSTNSCDLSVIATEFRPAFKWLRFRELEDTKDWQACTKVNITIEDDYSDDKDKISDDDIEEW